MSELARESVRLTLLLAALGARSASASGATWIVDAGGGGDALEIQQAVNLSLDGDTIIVRPGVYRRWFDLFGRELTIRSENPADPAIVAATVLDAATYTGRHLVITNGSTALIEGLTFVNAYERYNGGSTHVSISDVTFRHCVWRNNECWDAYAGAVFIYDANVLFERCVFEENVGASSASAVLANAARVVIRESRIANNTSDGLFTTSQVVGWPSSTFPDIPNSLTLIDNVIVGDSVGAETDLTATGNVVFCGNRGGIGGEGLIADNVIIGIGGESAGIWVTGNSTVSRNTIVGVAWGLTPNPGDSIISGNLISQNLVGFVVHGLPGTNYQLRGNLIHENVYLQLFHYGTGIFTLPNNLYVSPQFRDPGVWTIGQPNIDYDDFYTAGDPRLTRTSPCIDAGDPGAVLAPDARDVDGRVRLSGPRVDIGAFEYPLRGDLDGDGRFTLFDVDAFILALIDRDAHAGAYPLAAAPPLGADPAGDINGDGRFDNFDIDAFVGLVLLLP